ncbi:MAG: hypothetical protein PVI99_07805 [Anaerolineales bacterium]|jgi:hypothetical protein
MAGANITGAILALWIYVFSIVVFIARLIEKPKLERWGGILTFLSGIPLLVLLLTAHKYDRTVLYYIQIGFMLLWIVVAILVDYIIKLEFRDNLRLVIAYVVLFFAGTGGMLGVASLAGTGWMTAALVLFFIMAGLAFYQRAKTGK